MQGLEGTLALINRGKSCNGGKFERGRGLEGQFRKENKNTMQEEPFSNRPPESDEQKAGGASRFESGEGNREEEPDSFGARAGEHFKQGAADAAKAVNEFVPKLRSLTERSIYKGVYGMSFGVNFTGKLVKDVVVDNVVKGAREGASAGRDAATQYRQRRRAEAADTVVDVTEVDPTAAPA